MHQAEVLLEVMLNLLCSLANVATGDWEEGPVGIICNALRRGRLANPWSPVEPVSHVN